MKGHLHMYRQTSETLNRLPQPTCSAVGGLLHCHTVPWGWMDLMTLILEMHLTCEDESELKQLLSLLRWKREYLTALKETHKVTGNNEQRVKDDTPRIKWKLAVIEAV